MQYVSSLVGCCLSRFITGVAMAGCSVLGAGMAARKRGVEAALWFRVFRNEERGSTPAFLARSFLSFIQQHPHCHHHYDHHCHHTMSLSLSSNTPSYHDELKKASDLLQEFSPAERKEEFAKRVADIGERPPPRAHSAVTYRHHTQRFLFSLRSVLPVVQGHSTRHGPTSPRAPSCSSNPFSRPTVVVFLSRVWRRS